MRLAPRHRRPFYIASVCAGLLLGGLGVNSTRADEPAPAPTTRPLLQQLNRETQSLFKEIGGGVVRLQVPMPSLAEIDPESPLGPKWSDRLNDQVKRELQQQMRDSGAYVVVPSTQPTTDASHGQAPVIRIQPRHAGSALPFTPNAMGIVLDDQGHVLVPVYVDPRVVGDRLLLAALGDGQIAAARFVGSDQKTNLTVLQLVKVKAVPVKLATAEPQQGDLVLVVPMDGSRTHLAVWTGFEPDLALLVNIDGGVAGFTHRGQLLCAAPLQSVARQLIDHGHVERAFLGVRIQSVPADDPERQADAALAARPALRVMEVVRDSAADHAGIRPNDLILTLAHEAVGDPRAFAAAIAAGNGATEMQILRAGAPMTLSVDLQPK